ncbi:MAG: PKD domain-containing protein [Candidatus Hydrogenedentes bacterium]|nr:PKD domain-containing protein [Candidatus Hydrogenedentota bacterium]
MRSTSAAVLSVFGSCFVLMSYANAVPVAGDVDQTQQVDAVDVQLVINSALGLGVQAGTNIDYSASVDAVDVQLVINAALAIDIDQDDDGLCDAAETNLNTLVDNPDSDDDGIGDGQEMLDGTNPLFSNATGGIVGWVTDTGGSPLAGVMVTRNGGNAAYTDAQGLFQFPNLASASGVVVGFAKDGYTTDSQVVEVTPEQLTTVNSVLKQLGAPVSLVAEQGGEAQDITGNRIQLPPGAIVNSNKKAVTGEVSVQITALDVSNPNDLAAFPGNFTGISAGKDGEPVQLETFALADFSVTQNGEPLDLADGATAPIELALPPDTKLTDGEEVPLWSFDETQGVWIQNGVGVVGPASDGSGLAYFAEVPHLSWWNCDRPLSEKHCLIGRVVDADRKPVVGAQVHGVGVDYNGTSYAVTDANGQYCIDVKRGSQVRLDVTLPGGAVVVRSLLVNVSAEPASCATGVCTPVEDLVAEFDSCVSGYVKDHLGNPIAEAIVYSSGGSQAVTDENGYFCMEAPGDVDLTLFTLGRPPVEAHTNPTGTCEAGDCVQVILDRKYPEDGDLVGIVHATGINEVQVSIPKELRHFVRAQAAFGLGKAEEINLLGSGYLTGIGEHNPIFADKLDMDSFRLFNSQSELWEWWLGVPIDLFEDSQETVFESFVALDPGAPGAITAAEQTKPMYRLWDIYGDFFGTGKPKQFLNNLLYGVFVNWVNSDLQYRIFSATPITTAAFSWPGGGDLGAFETSILLPTSLLLTAPEIYSQNWVNMAKLDVTRPLTVTWETAGKSGESVQILLQAMSYVQTQDANEQITKVIVCRAADDGSFTIPVEVMSQLPEEPSIKWGYWSYSQYLYVHRFTTATTNVPLVKRPGSGVVRLYGSSDGAIGQYYSSGYMAPPTANFSFSPEAPAPNSPVQFTDLSTPGAAPITSWAWDFGDGTGSPDQNPIHTFPTAGIYYVSLTVTTIHGTSSATRAVVVTTTGLLDAEFTPNVTEIFAGEAVGFQDQTTFADGTGPIRSWLWAFGDGLTSDAPNPVHIYTVAGLYTVSLTTTTDFAVDTETKTDLILVKPTVPPDADFSFSPESPLVGSVVEFTDLSTPGTAPITGWTWDFGDGSISTDPSPPHTYTLGGTFVVQLTVFSAHGNASRSREVIVSVVGPIAEFTATPLDGPAGVVVQFADQSTPGTAPILGWLWDFGDGVTSVLQNPAHIYAQASTWTVSLTVTTAHGSDTETKVNFVTSTAKQQ